MKNLNLIDFSNSTILLNIGCGIKTASHPHVVNMDWSPYLAIKQNSILFKLSRLFLNETRYQRLQSLPDTVLVHDLCKGIPFPDNSVHAVYHSHFLEHLNRKDAPLFLQEVKRVLKPHGIHRIVVPDLETLCRVYLDHLEKCTTQSDAVINHESYIAEIIEQMVRREAYGTSQQSPLRRLIENALLGDARKRGETHQWMYDKINLGQLLAETGYEQITVQRFNTSLIPAWNRYCLDRNEQETEYKPGSLYMEAIKP